MNFFPKEQRKGLTENLVVQVKAKNLSKFTPKFALLIATVKNLPTKLLFLSVPFSFVRVLDYIRTINSK